MELEDYKLFGSLGDYVKYLRKINKITMKELTEASDVSQPYLSLLENNKNKPSDEMIKEIALGISKLTNENNEEEMSKQLTQARNFFSEKELRRLVLRANTKSSMENEAKKAEDTVNLNHILDFFEVKKEIEENIRKRKNEEYVDTIDRFHNYTILLDDKQLTHEEITMLQTLLLGLREKRKEAN